MAVADPARGCCYVRGMAITSCAAMVGRRRSCHSLLHSRHAVCAKTLIPACRGGPEPWSLARVTKLGSSREPRTPEQSPWRAHTQPSPQGLGLSAQGSFLILGPRFPDSHGSVVTWGELGGLVRLVADPVACSEVAPRG